MNPDEFKVQVVNFEGDVIWEAMVWVDGATGDHAADGFAAVQQAGMEGM